MQISRQVSIQLKTGEVLTIDISDKLLSQIKNSFDLTSDDQVLDKHVKYFLASSMKNFLEITKDGEPH